MKLKNLSKKVYKTYLSKYPGHENFLQNVIEKDDILHQLLLYTYSPVEDIEVRNELEKNFSSYLNRDYIQQLLVRKEEEGKPLEPLQRLSDDFHIVRYADTWKNRVGENLKQHGIETIAQIREGLKVIERVDENKHTRGEKEIHEKTIYQWFPFIIFTDRLIIDKKAGKTKEECEFEYTDSYSTIFPSSDIRKEKSFWESYSITYILQKFYDIERIKRMVFDLPPINEHSIIIIFKGEREELPFNLFHRERYYNLISKAIRDRKHLLESDKSKYIPDKNEGNVGLGIYEKLKRAPGFSVAIMAVYNASFKYKGTKEHGYFPGYLRNKVYSHMKKERERATTTQLSDIRREMDRYKHGENYGKNKEYPILKADLEHSGGSLDEEIQGKKAEKGATRTDLIKDDKFLEDFLIKKLNFENIKNSLSDPIDREILGRYYENDENMTKIANSLDITPQAVSKRKMKIENQIENQIKKMIE